MKQKLPVIITFLVVAGVGFGIYYIFTNYLNKPEPAAVIEESSSGSGIQTPPTSEKSFQELVTAAPAGGYRDPKNNYWIMPPEKWQLIDKDFVMKAGMEQLPSNLKDWVKPANVDVMFMDTSNPGQFGSNLNIILLQPSFGLQVNDDNFPDLKNQMLEQYSSMGLSDFRLIDAKVKQVGERGCAYFEIGFTLLNNKIRTIQLIIPGKSAATILTYTLNDERFNNALRKMVEESFNSFIPNTEMGF